MKKFLMVSLLLMCMSVSANDITIYYTDSIVGGDTAAEAVRCDTVYSYIIDISKFNSFTFFSELTSDPYNDTAWADDTFWVDFQHSFNRKDWRVIQIDTFLASGADWSAVNLKTTASIIGNWGRARLIHWDTLGADTPGIEDNVYKKKLQLWIGEKR